MKNIFITLILIIIVYPIMSSCTIHQEPSSSKKIITAVTIQPQIEFIQKIGSDLVDVFAMIPPGANPHTYEPTPSQITYLTKAIMYAKVGSGIEFELVWMDKLEALNKKMKVIDCSEGIRLIDESDNSSTGHGHRDPHIWMSPINAQIMVKNITDGLVQIDPNNRQYYENNADSYIRELINLDYNIRNSLKGLDKRTFIVYHPSFAYFSQEYGLNMISIEKEGKEPSAIDIANIINIAKKNGIKSIFVSPQFNPQSAKIIAKEIGGDIVFIDPLARNYIENISYFLNELVKSFKN